jgi:FkbM family methyltransferase
VSRFATRLAHLASPKQPALPPALHGGDFISVEVDVGCFWLPAGDEVMRPYFQHRRAWEESTGALLRRFFRAGTRFLDVGAAIGYFSVFAARAAEGVTIDSVEPNPLTVDLLRFNLWLNGVEANVWPVALDATRGSLPLSSSKTNLGDARTGHSRPGTAYSLVVPALPADQLFAGRTFDLVKIDVQGWEFEVVLGMQRIMDESPDIAIVAEYWPAALRQRDLDPVDTLEKYRKLGLEVVVVREGALEQIADERTVAICDSAGPDGQVNLLLRRK